LWNSASTWLTSTDGGSTWFPATAPPTGSENITVDDTVEVDVAVSIAGYLTVSGTGNLEISTGSITFANGSTYEHARTAGGIPPSTWGTGSTCKITGVTSQAPANRNQSYYNLIWNCPGQSGNLNMGFNNVTIGGDITIQSTGASGRWYLCAPLGDSTVTVTLMGDLIQTAGQVSSNGTGNGNTTIIIHQYGDINASNGNFSVSRGSQGGTGTTSWYLQGTNFSLTNVTTQNSNPDGAKFIFAGITQQNLSLTNVTFSGGFPVEVASNAILDVGTSEIAGSGIFTLNTDATLQTANIAGLDSTLKTSGTITLSTGAKYTFNGVSAQVTGILLPSLVKNLTVNNPADVTLIEDVAVTEDINVLNGDLHLDGHIIFLGDTGTLNETPGNTVTDLTGIISAFADLNAPNGANIGGLGAVFTSTDNLGGVSVERIHSSGTGNGNQGIFRQYLITFLVLKDGQQKALLKSDKLNLATTLRFYYDESELNGIPEINLTLFNSLDGTNNSWTPVGGTVNTANNYIEISNVVDIPWYWTLADINNPIPVELASFTTDVNDKGVILNWVTATETNNKGFEVERSHKSDVGSPISDWEKIGFVAGFGTTTEPKSYFYLDDLSGLISLTSNHTLNLFYRLRQIDFNGSYTYSDVVEVEFNKVPKDFRLYQNYPNPFNPSTVIKFDVPTAAFVNITIYNSIGERVATVVSEQLEAGVHFVRFGADALPSGIYFYTLSAGDIVFTQKMLLIK
jgi:hypothetical protein